MPDENLENSPVQEQKKSFRLPGGPKFYVAGGLVILAMAYLFFTAFQGAAVFYYTPTELKSQANATYGKQVRVNGKVVPGSVVKEDEKLIVHFELTDGAQSIPVTFKGIPPELFYQPHADVVAEGRYNQDGKFVASNLITRCASKYEPEA